MIKTFEKPDAISYQDWHNMQLHLIDQSGCQGLPRDICAASDGCVAITGCLLGGIDGRSNPIRNEEKFNRTPRHRSPVDDA